jgi:hypothetical protein
MANNIVISIEGDIVNLIELETLLQEEDFPRIITVVKNNVKLIFEQLYESSYNVSRIIYPVDNYGLPRSDACRGIKAKNIIDEILYM